MLKNRLTFLVVVLCLSALALHSASAATTLAAAGAQSGRGVGTALTANLLSNTTVTNIAGAQFSVVTPGNEMKWETTEPSQNSFNFAPGDQILNFGVSHGMKVRGH